MPSKIRKIFQRQDKLQVTQQAQQVRKPAVPAPLAQGDTPKALMPGVKVQPEEIRNLCELIRQRYALDVEIWDLRHVKRRDRDLVEDKMRRSDAMLQKIYGTVCGWDNPEAFESQKDWDKLQQIKIRIEEDGKRFWTANPPWDDQVLVDRSVRG